VGTLNYAAPEVLTSQYSFNYDVWSAGVILYVMLSGRLPFGAKTEELIMQQICTMDPDLSTHTWAGMSHPVKDMVSSLSF
jgi:serine/threonine protein kinase